MGHPESSSQTLLNNNKDLSTEQDSNGSSGHIDGRMHVHIHTNISVHTQSLRVCTHTRACFFFFTYSCCSVQTLYFQILKCADKLNGPVFLYGSLQNLQKLFKNLLIYPINAGFFSLIIRSFHFGDAWICRLAMLCAHIWL